MKRSGALRTLAVLAATACLTTLPVAYAGTPDGPNYQAPTVGTCTTMTMKQYDARSDRSHAVPCSRAHTARVVAVFRLPARLQWDTVSDARLFKVVVTQCLPRINHALGTNYRERDSSAYSYGYFVPTKNQRAHGARWISCSLVLRHGLKLAHLPTDDSPALPAGNPPDAVARCLTGGLLVTVCSGAHGFRTTGNFVVSGARYPGRHALDRKARAKCAALVTSRFYTWTYRDRTTWQVGGDHVVVCYSKTRA